MERRKIPAARLIRSALKYVLFGSTNFSRYRAIGLAEPQAEVGVWLYGLGEPLDVTGTSVVASAQPFTIGIGGLGENAHGSPTLKLELRERREGNRLLGEIGLRAAGTVSLGSGKLCLFESPNSKNYCVPRAWLWTRYRFFAYERWRSHRGSAGSNTGTVGAETPSVFAFYICPRPVVLLSVAGAGAINIVPMDLVGPVGDGYFTLALHSSSTAAPLAERTRRVALSSVPAEQTQTAYSLGKNHRQPGVDLNLLPFPTVPSTAFALPVPQFAMRVRELEIESARTIGKYTLFVARLVEDQRRAEGPQFFLVHGFYKRLAGRSTG